VRADFAFGERILDLADDRSNDWYYNEKTGRLSVNKEVVLRSRVRIEVREFHMSRLHPQIWGDKQTVENNWALLSEDERRRRADELVEMIREIKNPQSPPPLVYRAEEATDEPEPGGIGWQARRATGPKG
jgi:hypothetical protein